MKKILLFGFLFLLLLAAGAFFVFKNSLGPIAKAGVNKYGPGITQTKVELQDAKISPLSGEGTLTGLTVGNPQGWSAADLMRIGKVHISMEPKSVLQDHIVINELTIEQPEFVYETRLVASNVGDLLKNIEKSIGGTSNEPKSKDGKPIKMVVKKLVLKQGRVTVGLGGTALPVALPEINMTDIGVAEGGVTPAQLAFAVMRNVTSNVVAAATGAITKGGAGGDAAATLQSAKEIGSAIKGIFGGEKKTK